ncbi:hypothetical protein [Mesorhizobium marinum]|uniref:hypothetical protein n=1 Tax=Mesorhizobium marinum TaxID=3228790 RepID=UPI0034662BA0
MWKAKHWILHGMKRSGNHAVIDWILENKPSIAHINNPFEIMQELDQPGYFSFPVSMKRLIANRKRRKKTIFSFWPRRHLVSIEDWPVSAPLVDCQENSLNIILVRDPKNLFASRIRRASARPHGAYPQRMDATMRRAALVWLDHASEYFGDTTHLTNKVCIHFDRWLVDAQYRTNVANQLGVTSVKDPPQKRAREGGGSSFHARAQMDASEMDSLRLRWELLDGKERALLEEVMAVPGMEEMRSRLVAKE